jgi:hypothetical protein
MPSIRPGAPTKVQFSAEDAIILPKGELARD